MTYDRDERDSNAGDDGEEVRRGDDGETVRLRGSSAFTSMFTQRGRKGVNQDSMTIWEVNEMESINVLFVALNLMNVMDDLQNVS